MPNTKTGDDNSINQSDKTTLHGAGVDLSDTPVEPEGIPEKIVDMDVAVPDEEDPDLKKSGVKFVSEETPKPIVSAPTENKTKNENLNTKDLEAEFRSELADFKGPLKTGGEIGVMEKSGSLKAMLAKIQEKLGLKKKTVKSELESLKKMKDAITKDINEIKELEQSEGKINEELGKIEEIKKEVEEIEKDVAEDLKN